VERTKQLLKDGGVAGVILPSSILNNDGIYAKAREIILQYFKIIAITELGSNTFMATGTNTVVLFLRRRNNYDSINLRKSVERFFDDYQDVTRNGIEKPVAEYVNHVWENITIDDYITLLKKEQDSLIANHEIYKEYRKKIKAKTEKDFWNTLIETEKEKLYHFILAYPQKVVLIKTGEKDAEKRFLGYEFSNRRGSEGIHPIQRGKTIDECTRLFDNKRFDNPEKASTYIYKAFSGDYDSPVHESLKDNISRVRLVDMLTFDRGSFTKNISTAIKKKVKIESKWGEKRLDELVTFQNGLWKGEKGVLEKIKILRNTNFKLNNGHLSYDDIAEIDIEIKQLESRKLEYGDIILEKSGGSETQAIGRVVIFDKKDDEIYSFSNFCSRIRVQNEKLVNPLYLWAILNKFYEEGGTVPLQNGVRLLNLDFDGYKSIKIPLPSLSIQQQIVSEIEVLEKEEAEAKERISMDKNAIQNMINTTFSQYEMRLLGDFCESVEYGTSAKSEKKGDVPVIRMGNIQDGKIDWTDLVYTSNREEISKYSLKKNDVLFNRTNSPELVGKVGLYKGERPAIFAGYLIRINYKEDLLSPIFLAYVLNSETIRNHGFSVMSKSVNQANINGTLLKSYRIPIPPLSKQQKIVAEIEKIEVEIAESQKIINEMPALKNEVLKKYL
jgi:type I restriction enzyme M protein